jgi:hypothetical protein
MASLNLKSKDNEINSLVIFVHSLIDFNRVLLGPFFRFPLGYIVIFEGKITERNGRKV